LKYDGVGDTKTTEISAEGISRDGKFDPQIFRLKLVDVIRQVTSTLNTNTSNTTIALDGIKNLSSQIKKSPASGDSYVEDLVKDLEGQITEATSRSDWFTRWGKHYLPSLLAAHLNQQCNNFKDPGVQHYGGPLFSTLRDKLDEIFLTLPPPTPSRKSSSGSSTPVSMSSYYNSSAPCFAGNCTTVMSDGTVKCIENLKKGDFVMTQSGVPGKISCVVKTRISGGKLPLVKFPDGLLITPWHPVQLEGTWKFPAEVGIPEMAECPAVYSFLLESEHVMIINNIPCVTLGHGFSGPVVEHSYFGTQKVVEDLKKLVGWENGHVTLSSDNCMHRDTKTGLVNALTQKLPQIIL